MSQSIVLWEATNSTGSPSPLQHVQMVEQRLSANPLDPVVANPSAHSLQAQVPWIDGRSS
jgi:hypothetical protein